MDNIKMQLYQAMAHIYRKEPERALEQLYKVVDLIQAREHDQAKEPTYTRHRGGLQFVMENMGIRKRTA